MKLIAIFILNIFIILQSKIVTVYLICYKFIPLFIQAWINTIFYTKYLKSANPIFYLDHNYPTTPQYFFVLHFTIANVDFLFLCFIHQTNLLNNVFGSHAYSMPF